MLPSFYHCYNSLQTCKYIRMEHTENDTTHTHMNNILFNRKMRQISCYDDFTYSVCQCEVCVESQWECVEPEVGVRPDGVGWRILPCLEAIAVHQMMHLSKHSQTAFTDYIRGAVRKC